ncbi:hypothetical protein Scep_022871 [Stephania cephalantha]|uniref:Ketose-bisphosphate aldolase class-II family protein n=1 Tax=Stephania cephalantha TaxID=152367 RepID=A0AAP0F8V6_9MAGN
MSEKLYIFEDEVGAGRKVKMVNELLEGIHLVASMEAILLGTQSGIHPWILYDIISNAAGSSWVFQNHVPKILSGDYGKYFDLTTFVQNLRAVLDVAKSHTFPLPLLAVAHQQLLYGCSRTCKDNSQTALFKVSETVLGMSIADACSAEKYVPEKLAEDIVASSNSVKRVGFIGLGAMGFGMATHLLKSNYIVLGYDVYKPTLSRFESAGGLVGDSPAEVSKDVDVLIVMVANEAQAESALYGNHGAVSALPAGSSIILSSTVSPEFVSQLEGRLQGFCTVLNFIAHILHVGFFPFRNSGVLFPYAPLHNQCSHVPREALEDLWMPLVEKRPLTKRRPLVYRGYSYDTNKDEHKNLKLVDAPVSGGVARAALGTLTIMASGTDEALKSAGLVLSALSEKLYIIEGGCGAGSSMKMVNQLLAGVHIASAAEAMAFGARLGLHTRMLFEVIMNSGGASCFLLKWSTGYLNLVLKDVPECFTMFGNRVPHMLDGDYTPYSAVNIFVKDLGIVSHECSSRKIPLHISTVAHQQFISGSAAGWGRLDDAAVVKVYETIAGVTVEDKLPVLKKEDVLGSLPLEWSADPIEEIQQLDQNASKTLVVLDDDPTGTQTVHDIEVLTEWNVESLVEQFSKRPKCFFILTNSRALSSEKAIELTKDICRNLDIAAKSVQNASYTVVLRGDSTLRGHFPEATDAAVSVLGEMDAWIICPFFLQGGRYTIGDVHYVADSDRLVPAGETEFAKDASFGYKSSNLREWVEEKTKGRVSSASVASVSIQLLRKGGPDAVCEHLSNLQKAEMKGKRFLCRTAASFVSARIGIKPKAPITPKDMGINKEKNAGLIVVGSYVPKTTKQITELKTQCGDKLRSIEISVEKLALRSLEEREEEIKHAAQMADIFLRACKDTLIMTSRELITGSSPSQSLDINFKVSSALVEIVRRIKTRPRYILAKGGITSSDLATKALGARRAKVVGQALAGVPLWQLGPESKHPAVPYIVFPGNVGDSTAVAQVVKNWACPIRLSSTKELLQNAQTGGYAVGAFNVYNLEGVKAVIAAAEEENSPAILQIHPGAFKPAGPPLVACCVAAAEQAKVSGIVRAKTNIKLRDTTTPDKDEDYSHVLIHDARSHAFATTRLQYLRVLGKVMIGSLPSTILKMVPITVHFDHGSSMSELEEAVELGYDSLMVDGSHLPFKENISMTKYMTCLAHARNMLVEAELGRLSGTEDDLTVKDYEAKLTSVSQAREFLDETGIDALAVCIGNVHGTYPASGPNLRLDLLKDLHALSAEKGVFLVLHGASGLRKELIKECIELGVRKFNVNTEVRKAYMDSVKCNHKDLIHVVTSAKEAMKAVIAEKMRLFGSSGKA